MRERTGGLMINSLINEEIHCIAKYMQEDKDDLVLRHCYALVVLQEVKENLELEQEVGTITEEVKDELRLRWQDFLEGSKI